MQQSPIPVAAEKSVSVSTPPSPGKSMPVHVVTTIGAKLSTIPDEELSIRPNIRFAPRRRAGFSSLFDNL